MKKYIISITLSIFITLSFLFFTLNASAQTPSNNIDATEAQENAFLSASGINSEASVSGTVAIIISVLLGLLGIIFVSLLIYAGFVWMTAQGDEAKVSKAKGIIFTSIVGLTIVIAAYIITAFVFNSLNDVTYG
ncbi:MAG: hypothetical protein WC415_04510 [Patescibacteria group bacterium]|jgi:heme/copper-type cytochrome/quinol oxidase subunit 4